MATNTHNKMERNDNRTLWGVLAVAAIVILAFAAYAAYQNYENRNPTRFYNNMTNATEDETGTNVIPGGNMNNQ